MFLSIEILDQYYDDPDTTITYRGDIMNIESNKCNKGLVVAIEGLIGAGKSTLTNNLCQLCRYTAFNEAVESNPFLVDYYDDPMR